MSATAEEYQKELNITSTELRSSMAFAGDLPGFAGFDQQDPDDAIFGREIGVER